VVDGADGGITVTIGDAATEYISARIELSDE
jgi:hypothetical protein